MIDGTLDFEFSDRQAFGKVVAYYQDKKQAKRIEVEASGEASSDSVYRIPEPFADAAEADKAAQAKAKQLKRGEGSFSVDVIGDTGIQAGAPLVCDGIRPGLDGVSWLIDSVTHTISKSRLPQQNLGEDFRQQKRQGQVKVSTAPSRHCSP